MESDEMIRLHRIKYKKHWRDKPDWYWFYRVVLELIELFFSLMGIHKHPPEIEKMQIAGIMANWIEYRDENPSHYYGDDKI